MIEFLKKAFSDMKESAKARHEADKANLAAARAESKAQWEEAKAMMQAEREKQIEEAGRRKAGAEARIGKAQGK